MVRFEHRRVDLEPWFEHVNWYTAVLWIVESESNGPICMEGKEVSQVKSFKYLGVLLDDHINYVRSKVSSRLGLLSRLRGCLSTEAANKIYLSTVLPILSYCDTCFYPLGSTNRKCLERLQRRAARIVYGFKSDITTESILENLCWPPLTSSMEKHGVLLVNKCLVGEVPLHILKTISCYAARATTNKDVLDRQSLTSFFLNFI